MYCSKAAIGMPCQAQTPAFSSSFVLDEGDGLDDQLAHGLEGRRDQVDAQIGQLAEDVEAGAHHLQLGLDLQVGALAHVASMMSKPPRGMPKSIYLPSRTSMCSQSTPAGFQILDLRAQARHSQPRRGPAAILHFCCYFSNCVCHCDSSFPLFDFVYVPHGCNWIELDRADRR